MEVQTQTKECSKMAVFVFKCYDCFQPNGKPKEFVSRDEAIDHLFGARSYEGKYAREHNVRMEFPKEEL